MFSGIIGNIGTIDTVEQQGDLRVKIACDYKAELLKAGDSLSVSGACLTVVSKGFLASGKNYFTASLSQETVSCTVPGMWEKGRRVNLERALKIGDALDGHLVTGHIDGIATIKEITDSGDSHVICVEAPEALSRFIAEKGSLSLDGVSLTVNKVKGNQFWVSIVPYTWQHTTFSDRKTGDGLNLEIDLIARYVARLTG